MGLRNKKKQTTEKMNIKTTIVKKHVSFLFKANQVASGFLKNKEYYLPPILCELVAN